MYLKSLLTAGTALTAAAFLLPSSALAGPEGCDTRVNNTIAKLTECVTVEGVRAHQQAL